MQAPALRFSAVAFPLPIECGKVSSPEEEEDADEEEEDAIKPPLGSHREDSRILIKVRFGVWRSLQVHVY